MRQPDLSSSGSSRSGERAITSHRDGVRAPCAPSAGSLRSTAARPSARGSAGDDGRELEVAVRDVERDQSAGTELADVELDRLAREQVHRDGVGAERVDDHEVRGAVRNLGDRPAPVAEDDLHVRPRVPQVREEARVAGDACDRRVELVEGQPLARSPVRGQRADSEADRVDTIETRIGGEHIPERPAAPVVRQRFSGERAANRSTPWTRRPVEEPAFTVLLGHAQHPEERPLVVQAREAAANSSVRQANESVSRSGRRTPTARQATTAPARTACDRGGALHAARPAKQPLKHRQDGNEVERTGRGAPRRSASASTNTSGYSRPSRTRAARRARSAHRRALRRGRAGSRTPSAVRARVVPPRGARARARPRRRARAAARAASPAAAARPRRASGRRRAPSAEAGSCRCGGVRSGRRAKLTTNVRR